ncbi:MAG: hypothetical protein KJZ65_09105 [Phycisphaerales bacterium]|nr:hypothetical protein [Phycisphaerales bacterium]
MRDAGRCVQQRGGYRLIGDQAYDRDALDGLLAAEGTDLVAPHRSNRIRRTQDGRGLRRYKRRFAVERTIAWVQHLRRLCVRWLARRAIDVIFLILVFAGIVKLFDVPAFAEALLTWRYIPSAAILPLAYAVPLVELTVRMLWFLRLGERAAVCGGGVLLLLFTATYLFQTRDLGPPPDCGCQGKVIRYEAQQAAISGLVMRNGSLLVLLTLGGLGSGVFVSPSRNLGGHGVRVDPDDRACWR